MGSDWESEGWDEIGIIDRESVRWDWDREFKTSFKRFSFVPDEINTMMTSHDTHTSSLKET